jgi:hypothetical protein
MKPNEKELYTHLELETIRWDETDVILTSGEGGSKGAEGPKTPAYIRYEEDESED